MRYHPTNQRLSFQSGLRLRRIATKLPRLPERFYGDGPPHWTVGRTEKPSETLGEAERARKLAIRHLKQQAAKNESAARGTRFHDIRVWLETCQPDDRCLHPACPACMRALQRWFVWTAPVGLRRATGKAEPNLFTLSIIPNLRLTLCVSLPHTKDQVTRILTLLRNGLLNAGVTLLCGGIDISVNENDDLNWFDDARRRRVQLHLWAMGPENDIRIAQKKLRKIFGKSTKIERPVQIGKCDGNEACYAYALKTSFEQRKRLPPNPDKKTRWNTRKIKLTMEQHAEVMLILEMIGDRRLFLIGMEIQADDKGRPVIRPVKHEK